MATPWTPALQFSEGGAESDLGDGEYAIRGKKISKDCSDEINAAMSAWLQGQPHDTRLIPTLTNVEGAAHGQTLVASDPIPVAGDGACLMLKRLIFDVGTAVELGWIRHDLRKDDDNRKGNRQRATGKSEQKQDKDDDEGEDDEDETKVGVAVSIIKKLQKAHRDCLHGRFSNVRGRLRTLLKQVEAQRGKHLKDEAYYLIKFNVEYLLEKL